MADELPAVKRPSRLTVLLITAEIGPDEAEGVDLFDFVACSPDLLLLLSEPGIPAGANRHVLEPWSGRTHVWGRRLLFLRAWNYEQVLSILDDLVYRTEGSDWVAVTPRLSPYMHWEYEDYPGAP